MMSERRCSVKQCLNYNEEERNCWFFKKGYKGTKNPQIIPFQINPNVVLPTCDCFREDTFYREKARVEEE